MRIHAALTLAAALTAGPAHGDTKMALSPQRVAARIRQHRTAEVTLTVTDAAGKPLTRRPVTVRQVRHKFLFGCNAFRIDTADASPLQRDYQRRYADLLNFATLPFYWGSYERQPGRTAARKLGMMADWCRTHHIRTKGHPLCWHTVFPRWGYEKPADEIWRMQLHRIGREVKGFAGRIDTWDVVNEAVVMPNFREADNPLVKRCKQVGRVELIAAAFAAARKANPAATLLLNDFDTSPKYAKLIADCLAAGVTIDTIGIQSHMHGRYRGAEWAWETCERFAEFDKPLHFTETTIISGENKKRIRWHGPRYDDWASTPDGEKRQADQVAEFYTVLFSHPAVEAITWWDFSDHNAWLGAPSGLIRADMTPKPAYERLMKLVKGTWWTGEQTLTTDPQGRVSFRGYLGDYAVETGKAKGTFRVDSPGKVTVTAKAE